MACKHEWELYLQWDSIDDSDALCPFARCKHRGCDERLRYDEIEARLNENEQLKKENKRLKVSIAKLEAKLKAKDARIAELDVKIVLLMGESERAKEERDAKSAILSQGE